MPATRIKTKWVSGNLYFTDQDGNTLMIVDSAGNIDITSLQINNVAITATGAELNLLHGVTKTTAQLNAGPADCKIIEIENLAAGADITTRPVFVVPTGYTYTLTDIKILPQGSSAGVDDGNTAVIEILNGANSIVSKTYNTAGQPPAVGTAASLGALSATHKVLAAGAVVKVTVTQGNTADLPAFLIVLEYTKAAA